MRNSASLKRIGQISLIHFKATAFRVIEWFRVIFLYYRNLSFFWTDILLASRYAFKNPHRISRDFLAKRGESNVYQYGETPLTTLDFIACQCQILSKDIVYELGCGSGKTTFWLHSFVGCRVIAVDYLPLFIKRARWIKRMSRQEDVEFKNEDILTTDFKSATAIYLYGTCLEDEVIERLIGQFQMLPAGTKVITVSYPLTDYCSPALFKVAKQFSARFPWGKAIVYLNMRQ